MSSKRCTASVWDVRSHMMSTVFIVSIKKVKSTVQQKIKQNQWYRNLCVNQNTKFIASAVWRHSQSKILIYCNHCHNKWLISPIRTFLFKTKQQRTRTNVITWYWNCNIEQKQAVIICIKKAEKQLYNFNVTVRQWK